MEEKTYFSYLNYSKDGVVAADVKNYLERCNKPSQFYTKVSEIIEEANLSLGQGPFTPGTISERRNAEIVALRKVLNEITKNGSQYGAMYFSEQASPICIYNDEPLYKLAIIICRNTEKPLWCYMFGDGNTLINKLEALLEEVHQGKVNLYLNDQFIIMLQKNTLTQYKDYKQFTSTYNNMVSTTRANQEQAAEITRQQKEIQDLKKQLEDNNTFFNAKLLKQEQTHKEEMQKLTNTLKTVQDQIKILESSAKEDKKDALAWRQSTGTRTKGSSKFFKTQSFSLDIPTLNTGDKSPREEKSPRGETIPPEFICPISHGLMQDPVLAEDGITYENIQIKTWFGNASQKASPITHKSIKCTLRPNKSLKDCILQWESQKIPRAFFCPLTKKVMLDPVTNEEGISYDREAYEQYAAKSKKTVNITSNTNLKNWIQTYIAHQVAPSPRANNSSAQKNETSELPVIQIINK